MQLESLDSSHPTIRVSFEFPDKDDPGLKDRLTTLVQEPARNIKNIAESAAQSGWAAVAAQHMAGADAAQRRELAQDVLL